MAAEAPVEVQPEVQAAPEMKPEPKPEPAKAAAPPESSEPLPGPSIKGARVLPPQAARSAAPVAGASGGQNAMAFYRRGFALVQDEHFAEAIEQLEAALKLDPTMALAYNARGYAHSRLKQYPEALSDFDVAILLNPAYANAYLNRSTARRASGNAAGADSDLAKARELTPKSGK
jgi:tetratricopeptide (TPR) repeat protein